MSKAITSFCDVCKTETRRCEYYPRGRSRQHGKCLQCDKNDPTHTVGYRSSNPSYCYDCDRTCRAEKNDLR